MRPVFAGLVLGSVLFTSGLAAAQTAPPGPKGGSPAGPPATDAKEGLEKLKKALPDTLAVWAKGRAGVGKMVPLLRRARQTGPNQARLTIYLFARGESGSEDKQPVEPARILFVTLKYYDGLWTATGVEWSSAGPKPDEWNEAAYFLLDAIDQAAEK